MADAGIPDGVTIETVYVIEVRYTADAAERRPAVRSEHLARIAKLLGEGRLIEADAVALVRDDVYVRSGVWVDDLHARAYGRVVINREG